MKRTATILAGIFLASIIFILAGCGGGTSAPPPPATVPAAPAGVVATPGNTQVTISWTAVSGATSYNLYYSSTTANVTTTMGTKITGVTNPYVQTGLTNGTTYNYIVTAVNSIGESAPSSVVPAAPTATAPTVPAAPTGVTAVGGTGQVTVTWTAVTGATSYNIYYSTTTGVTTANGTKLAGVTSPDIVTGLAASTNYFFIVTAVNSAGESAASSQAPATTLVTPPSGGPATPTIGTPTSNLTNSVRINWTAVAGATSYNIYRGTATGVTIGGTGVTQIPVSGGTTATFLDSGALGVGLAAGTQYFYIMTAVNASGESLPSTEVNATTSTTDGVALYTANCANQSCHAHGTTLANSSFKPTGRTAAQITSAISGVSAMNFLSTLTSAQIQAIADVLTF